MVLSRTILSFNFFFPKKLRPGGIRLVWDKKKSFLEFINLL